jgi:hypothetical protein
VISKASISSTIESATPGIAYDDPHFEVGQRQFPIQVFSLANSAPWAPNFICVRYELENVGNQTIPLLYWKLIEEWGASDLLATERRVRTRRRPSAIKDPVRGPTVIKDFRSEVIDSTAWQTVEDYQDTTKKATQVEQSSPLHFQRSAELDPAAARAIANSQIPDAEVAVIEPIVEPSGPPAVRDVLK